MNEEVKILVEKYCTGSIPTEEQENEIMGKALDMGEDTDKVLEYMEECKQKKAKPVEKIKEESQVKEKKSSPSAAVKQKKEKKDNKTTPASKKHVAAKKEVLDVDKLFEESEGSKDVGGHFDLFSDEPLIEDGCDEKDFDPVKIFAPIAEKAEQKIENETKRKTEREAEIKSNREAAEKTHKTSILVLLCLLIGFPLIMLIVEGWDLDLSNKMVCICVSGIIVSLIAACLLASQTTTKVISWLFALFYVLLGISSFFIVSEELYKANYKAFINADHLENFLSKRYGQEYDIQVESSESVHKRISGKDVLFEVKIQEFATQNKDTVWLIETDEGVSRLYRSGKSISRINEISSSISFWFDGN